MSWTELQPCLLPVGSPQQPGKAGSGKAKRRLQPAAGLGKPLTKALPDTAAQVNSKAPPAKAAATSSRAPIASAATKSSKAKGASAAKPRDSPLSEKDDSEGEEAELAHEGVRQDTPAMARVAAGMT